MALHPREQHGLATAHDPGEGHDAALVNGGFEILEDVLVIVGVIIRHRMQALTEAKVLHDVAEHGRVLLSVYRGARGDAARGPTPCAWSRSPPAGH